MKKLRKLSLLLVLELGCMGAAMPGIVETENVSFTCAAGLINSTDGNGNPGTDSKMFGFEPINTSLFNTASWTLPESDEGDFFLLRNGKKVITGLSEGDTYKFPVTTDFKNDGSIFAYYTTPNVCIATFVDQSGNHIGDVVANKGENIASYFKGKTDSYKAPTGYACTWVDDNGAEVDIESDYVLNKNTIFTAKLTKDENSKVKRYDVFVQRDSGIEAIKHKDGEEEIFGVGFDEQVTVTSTAENFSYWMIGEKIVSYENEYSFSVYSDTVIKEVCGIEAQPKPVITLHRDQINDSKFSMTNLYEVKYEVPEGYKFVEAGMIFGGTTISASGVEKIVAKNITSNNEFSVKSSNIGEHRAYLIYKNGSAYEVVYDDGYGVEQLVFYTNSLSSDSNYGLSSDAIDSLITSSHSIITTSVCTIPSTDKDGNPINKQCAYEGKDSTIKIGATGNNGVLGFTSDTGKFDKANVMAYSADESTLSAEGADSSFEMTSEAAVHTYNFETAVSEFKVSTSAKRANISYIELFYADREKSTDIDLSALSLGDLSKIYDNIALPTKFEGNDITWTSSNPSVIANDGSVTTPDKGSVKVKLVAKVGTSSKSFIVNVYSASEAASNALESLSVPSEVADDVLSIDLPKVVGDASIFWTSDNEAIDYKGNVTHGEGDVTVTLNAKATVGKVSKTKDFTVLVKAKKKINGVELDATTLGLKSSYSDVTTTINTIKYVFIQGCTNSNKIQMRHSGGVQSMLYNDNGYETHIKSITINLASTLAAGKLGIYVSDSVLDNSVTPLDSALVCKNTADSLTIKYENKENNSTIKFFRIQHLTSKITAYISSIVIELA